MESFLTSLAAVGLAEIGDRTQLLTLLLASRFKKPFTVIAGIFLATFVNHAIAGELGAWISEHVGQNFLRYVLAGSFLVTAIWMLKPEKISKEDTKIKPYGAFFASFIAFFLAEIGDKTQIVTAQLAAEFHNIPAVVGGTVLGMMAANVPVVFMSGILTRNLPIKPIRFIAAIIFAILGVVALFNIHGG